MDLDAAPAPWSYNPSAWSQRIPICLIAMLGFFIAGYMALYQWRVIGTVVDPVFGAQSMQVLDSDVSHTMRRWLGIPDAALGALAYLGDAIFGLAGSTRRWQFRPWLVVLFGIDVIPQPATENPSQDREDGPIGFGPVELLDLLRVNPSGLRMLLRMGLPLNAVRVVNVEHDLPAIDSRFSATDPGPNADCETEFLVNLSNQG